MFALRGYYDGTVVQPLEQMSAKKNQKVIITILDEFLDETPKRSITSARGSLAKYSNTALWEQEEKAWEEAVGEKYDNA